MNVFIANANKVIFPFGIRSGTKTCLAMDGSSFSGAKYEHFFVTPPTPIATPFRPTGNLFFARPRLILILGNGSIEPDELKTVMKHCIEESDLQLSEEALETLTLALFEEADADGSGMISYEELCDVLENHPDVLQNLTIR